MSDNRQWEKVCSRGDLTPNIGVRALLNDEQVAIFSIKDDVYAVNAIDPFTNAAVLARGIVGDIGGTVVVASPIHKQHFSLTTGQCLEDEGVSIKVYPVRDNNGDIELAIA